MTKKWFFDDYPSKGTAPSWVQLSPLCNDVENGEELSVWVKGEKKLTLSSDLDQWGTWINIQLAQPTVVAQEWSTRSFVQALIAGLQEFLKLCDLEQRPEAQTPTYIEEPSHEAPDGRYVPRDRTAHPSHDPHAHYEH